MSPNSMFKKELISKEEALINSILFNSYNISKSIFKEVDYNKFIKIGSSQLLLPAIYINLKRQSLLKNIPIELGNYLKEIHKINENRNKVLLEEVDEISTLLNKNNINYAFTKGAALIIGNYYGEIGERMIGDIDIIVHENDIIKTSKILKGINYYQTNNVVQFNHRHLPRFLNKKRIFAIEIHKNLIRDKFSKLMPSEEILKNKKIGPENIPFVGDKDLFKNMIYSFQINDLGYYKLFYNMKCSYDINSIYIKTIKKINQETINLKFIKEYLLIHDLILKTSIIKQINLRDKIYRFRYIICRKYKFLNGTNILIANSYLLISNYKYKSFKYFTDSYFRNYFHNKILQKIKIGFR